VEGQHVGEASGELDRLIRLRCSEITGRGDCTGFTPENAPRTW